MVYLKSASLMEMEKNGIFEEIPPVLASNSGKEDEGKSNTAVIERSQTKLPKRYKVLLHNDDYTTMEFVVEILQRVFRKTFEEAQEIMWNVHRKGVGVCGVYTYEIAETKAVKVKQMAKERGYPLRCSLEPE